MGRAVAKTAERFGKVDVVFANGASPSSCSRPDVARDVRAGHPHEPGGGFLSPCPEPREGGIPCFRLEASSAQGE